MATTVDELQVLITADVARLKQGLNVVQKQLASLKGSTGTAGKSMSASMVAAGTIIGNIATSVISAGFSAISSSVDGAISRLDTLNNYERVMSNLGIGASDAQKSIQVLQEALLGLPTTLDDASLSVQRLVSANGNIAASTDMFLAFNNALLAGGAGADIQRAALEQMMQAYAKGKPEAEEWRSLMTAMPAQLKQIATALGYTSTAIGGDLYNDIQTGKLSMDDFMLTIVKLNKEGVGGFESFETQARNSTGGVATSITNLKTAITRGITDVMNVIGQSNIAGFFNNIASVIGNVATYVAAFVKIIKEAVAWIGALFGGSGSTENLVKETGGAADNMESVSSGAASAAGSLNDAGSAAKKLKNQLAGFDEMNVLTESSSGSGGGSGGSGGGGGAGSNLGDYNWDSSGLTNGAEKIEAAVKKIKDALKGIFGDLNLDKIGNALKQFSKDVSKFMKPVKKILGEVWEDYLQPFLEWSGNSLLPAVFNAIGGAISLLGGIISSLWDNWLKPFIDSFLVPIAEFTGGIIISVLNGIGNALRAIGENQTAVNAIVASLVTLTSLVAAAKITTVVNSLIATIPTLVAGVTSAITVFRSAYSASMTLNSALGAMAAASTGSTSAIAGLGQGLLGMVEAVCSPVGIAILGVVAAITAIVTAMEAVKLKTMEAQLAESQYRDATTLTQDSLNSYNEALERQKALKDEIEEKTRLLADANLAMLNAQEQVRQLTETASAVASQYGMTLEEARLYVQNLDLANGNLTESDRELANVILQLESGEGQLTEATKRATEARDSAKASSELYAEQARREVAESEKARLAGLLQEGQYGVLVNRLKELTAEGYTYTDENGKQVKVVGEDVKNLVDFFGDEMARGQDDNSRAWKAIWDAAGRTIDGINLDIDTKLKDGGRNAGVNWALGVGTGASSKGSWLNTTIVGLGNNMLSNFRSSLGIHSPSKVMAQVGAYMMEGLGQGLSEESSSTLQTLTNVGDSLVSTIRDSIGDAVVSIPSAQEITDRINPMDASLSARLREAISGEIELRNQEIQLQATLKIDGKDIPVSLDFAQNMADSLNNLSSIRNRSVVQF